MYRKKSAVPITRAELQHEQEVTPLVARREFSPAFDEVEQELHDVVLLDDRLPSMVR